MCIAAQLRRRMVTIWQQTKLLNTTTSGDYDIRRQLEIFEYSDNGNKAQT